MELMVTTTKRAAYEAFAERLLEACRDDPTMPKPGERGFLKALGKKAGIGYKGAEKWVKGLGMPDMGNGSLVAQNLGVSFEWLMTGRGQKNVTYSIAEGHATYGLEVTSLAKDIASLPTDVRSAVMCLIDFCVRKAKQ